jgi:hypothetical protein
MFNYVYFKRHLWSAPRICTGSFALCHLYGWNYTASFPGGITLIVVYGDDILLYHSIKTQKHYYILQQDIALLEAWISQRYLQLNPAKCKHIIVSRKHLPIQLSLQLRICGAPIEKVSSFKYLGVWLSENLKWNAHIQQITKKARRQAGVIFRRFYNPQCLQQLYLSFVQPHLEYAASVWNPHRTSQRSHVL